jgi:hypothetical protein
MEAGEPIQAVVTATMSGDGRNEYRVVIFTDLRIIVCESTYWHPAVARSFIADFPRGIRVSPVRRAEARARGFWWDCQGCWLYIRTGGPFGIRGNENAAQINIANAAIGRRDE